MNQNFIKKIGLFISPFAISPIIAFSSSTNQIKAQSPQYTLTNVNKKVDVLPQGTVAENSLKEQRSHYHSELTPTGFFVPKNTRIDLEFDHLIDLETLLNFAVMIGQWGSYDYLNDGFKRDLLHHYLEVDPNNPYRWHIVSQLEGMVYLVNRDKTKTYSPKISASNVVKIPTFNVDLTNVDDFVYDYVSQKKPPFIELVGKNSFATVTTKIFDLKIDFLKWTQKYSLNELVRGWDRIYYLSNRVSGLNNDPTSIHYKHPNKLHFAIISNTKLYAYADTEYTGYSLEAGHALLTTVHPQYNWLLWHEVGHTYQNKSLKLNVGYTEVTVNINSLWIQEHLGYRNKFITWDKEKKIVKDFLAQNNKVQNSIEKLGIWEKLMMFWQLNMAYGREFYPRLHQSYRLLPKNDLPKNDYQKHQMFIVMTSKLVKRNLIPFFDKWSIYADQNTINQVQGYPLLSKDIWNNMMDHNFDEKTIVDYFLE